MSDDQKDAVVGRAVREYRENEEHIGRLRAEAARLGERLSSVGQALVQHPEGVCPDSSGLEVQYSRARVGFNNSDFDVDRLTALTNDYRAALKKKDTLENELERLGFPTSRPSRPF